jgi:multidrug efflux system membrane fusion protein
MYCRPIWAAVCCCSFLAAVAIGGGRLSADDGVPAELPTLPVSQPVERQVVDFVDFAGKTEAAQSVKIIPRVTGYLTKTAFKEGSEVKRGDVLFEIDPRPYQAQLDQAQSQLVISEARLNSAKTDNARGKQLGKASGAISQSDLDHYQAAEDEAIAAVQGAKASLEIYKLNLAFCQVMSPIDGQAGRSLLAPGNLVKQDETMLTTVVSSDPMYVYFDMDERTLLHIRRAINDGRLKPPEGGAFPVSIGLQDESGFPHQGTVDFLDNRLASETGTVTLRAVVKNPKPASGTQLMSPGMAVRVRLPLGWHAALLVSDWAIAEVWYATGKRLSVVGADDKVEWRNVEIGAIQRDGLREITSGLKAKERVIADTEKAPGPGTKVRPVLVPMPTIEAAKPHAAAE